MAATFKYFSGSQEVKYTQSMNNKAFSIAFPGIKGIKYDGYSKLVSYSFDQVEILPITRSIQFKSNPSLHKCDGRCVHAKGHICECACGGANHGTGS